jgi:hypothetical protein
MITSCEKKPDTDIEIIQDELIQFVNDNNITKCDIVVIAGDQYHTYYSSVSFSIGNGFVTISDGNGTKDKYNLLFLSRYALQIDIEKKIIMFFS